MSVLHWLWVAFLVCGKIAVFTAFALLAFGLVLLALGTLWKEVGDPLEIGRRRRAATGKWGTTTASRRPVSRSAGSPDRVNNVVPLYQTWTRAELEARVLEMEADLRKREGR